VTLPARYVGARGLRHPVCAPDPRRVWPMDHGTATGWQDGFPAPEPAGASPHDDGPESPRAAPAPAATSGSGVIATRSLVGGAARRASSAWRVRVLESAVTAGIPLPAVGAVRAVPSVRPAQADTAYEMRFLRGGRVIRTGHGGCTARSSGHCRMPFLGRRPHTCRLVRWPTASAGWPWPGSSPGPSCRVPCRAGCLVRDPYRRKRGERF
jgi:hypothetical protein